MIARGLFRSAGFRFGVVYALLLAVSATALAMFLWWATAGLLDRQTEAAINADAQGLSERWADGGLPALVVTIEDRLAQNIDDDAIYLLVDPTMKRIAGNLASWPSSVTTVDQGYELPVMRAGMKSLATVQRYELPGGFPLLIGRDVQVRAQLRKMLTDALVWAGFVVILMATAGALVIRSLFRRTLANISATSVAIAGGDFAQRVRLTGRGDEFDQIAEVINDMLDRIGRLMDGVRQVSNAIAHDLRTPITRARTRLEDAALHAESADDLRAAIERATWISTASSGCSRRCCGSRRSRPGPAGPRSPGSISPRCWTRSPICTARWRKIAASTCDLRRPMPCRPMATGR